MASSTPRSLVGYQPSTSPRGARLGGEPEPSTYQPDVNHTCPGVPVGSGSRGSSPMESSTPGTAPPTPTPRMPPVSVVSAAMRLPSVVPYVWRGGTPNRVRKAWWTAGGTKPALDLTSGGQGGASPWSGQRISM